MQKNKLVAELQSIRDELEEVLGVCLGYAPDKFYTMDEGGEDVIIMAAIKPFAKRGDKAFRRLHDLIGQI